MTTPATRSASRASGMLGGRHRRDRPVGSHALSLITAAGGAFSMRALGAVLSFGFNVLLARSLGPDGAGTYLLALTVVTIGTVFGRRGLDNALVRFVAAHAEKEEWGGVGGVHRQAMAVSATTSAVITLLLVAGAPVLATRAFSKPELTVPLQVMSLAILPMSLALLHGESLKGLGHIVSSQFTQWVVLPAFLLLLGWPALRSWGAPGGAAVYASASLATLGAGLLLWRQATPHLPARPPAWDRGRLTRTGTPLLWAASLNMVMTWIGMVTLGVFASASDVGVFGVASRLSVLVSFVLVAVNGVASPRFAALHASGRTDELRRLVTLTGWVMALLAGPVLLVILTRSEAILSIFGAEFVSGAGALQVLCLGQAALVLTGPATPLLMMTGYEIDVRNAIGVSAMLAVLLNLVLVPAHGVWGAAAATSVTLPLVNVIAAVQAWRSSRIVTVTHVPLGGGRA